MVNKQKITNVLYTMMYCFHLIAQSSPIPSLNKTNLIKLEALNQFNASVYYLPETTVKLPDFKTLIINNTFQTNYIFVKNQPFFKGFPGVVGRTEFFGIVYSGQFFVKDTCNYCFQMGSDDGARLLIDNTLLIENDFQHPFSSKINCIKLEQGLHKIELQYYQGPKINLGLTLQYKKNTDKVFQIFNIAQFYPFAVYEKDKTIDLSFGDEILFDYNKAELNEQAQKTLNKVNQSILSNTKIKSIIIEGHTDDKGSAPYNMKLSLHRANSVKDYLISLGIKESIIVTKGSGKTRPRFPNNNDENRKKNRRIDITIVKEK